MLHWRVIFALSCCLIVGCAGSGTTVRSSAAAGGHWTQLGTRTVQGKLDRDIIGVSRGKGTFNKLKIEVKGSALELHNLVVTFASGKNYSPATKLVFKKGSWSRTIDLPGRDRTIREIAFRYSNLPGGGRAHVTVYGR